MAAVKLLLFGAFFIRTPEGKASSSSSWYPYSLYSWSRGIQRHNLWDLHSHWIDRYAPRVEAIADDLLAYSEWGLHSIPSMSSAADKVMFFHDYPNKAAILCRIQQQNKSVRQFRNHCVLLVELGLSCDYEGKYCPPLWRSSIQPRVSDTFYETHVWAFLWLRCLDLVLHISWFLAMQAPTSCSCLSPTAGTSCQSTKCQEKRWLVGGFNPSEKY